MEAPDKVNKSDGRLISHVALALVSKHVRSKVAIKGFRMTATVGVDNINEKFQAVSFLRFTRILQELKSSRHFLN